MRYWIERYAVMVPASLIIVWICNRAKGSILVAGITHAAANTADAFIPRSDMLVLCTILYGVGLVLLLIDRM